MATLQGPLGLAASDYPAWYAQVDQVLDSVLGDKTPRVGQLEVAPTTGRAHVQATWTLADKRAVTAVQKDLAKAAAARTVAVGVWLEARQGSEEEAARYCTKVDSAWRDVHGAGLLTWRVWESVADCSGG